MTVAYITHPSCRLHEMGANHPESPQRLAAIHKQLADSGLLDHLVSLEAAAATPEQLALAHPGTTVEHIIASAPAEGLSWLDGDTAMNPHSLDAALHAAGAVCQAVDGVLDGQFQRAFCAVRPPGHHAEAALPMGFCLFNNVAIAALQALARGQVTRLAILDFDVHHGNGTVDIFKDDPRVMVCSSFQYPFYPGRLQTLQRQHIVNTPLPAGTASQPFRAAIERQWLPALQQFSPELVLVSAGFDAHRQDPLAQLNLEDEDYRWLTEFIVLIANSYSEGRVVSVLEGGYHLDALARSCHQHIAALLES